jgi:apolipoprotein N-acyltransferase
MGPPDASSTSARRRRLAVRLAAAVAIGPCFWAAVPDTDLWWLGFLCWLPWLWLTEDLSPRAAFWFGLVTGVSAISVGYFWMTELLTRFAFPPTSPTGEPGFGAASMPLSIAVHLVFSMWQGAGWGLSAALLVWMRRRTGLSPAWLLGPCWVAVEAFLPHLFPTYMALAWCWQPTWIQLAEIGGPTAVTFAMCSINGALYVVLRTAWERRILHRRAFAAFLAWIVGVPIYGQIRIHMVEDRIDAAPKVDFGVAQGNFGIDTFRGRDAKRTILHELQRVTGELEREGADLALWGETAYPWAAFTRAATSEPPGRLKVRRQFTIPLVFGAVTREADRNVNPYPWNSALVLERNGAIGDRYDKVYPLLFGEAAPSFVDAEWYLDLIPNASHINRGDGPGVLTVEGWRLGPLICYEDILPRYVRATAVQDVHVLVNLTNDSWFGNTREQPEHLGLAVFRAVEHRKGLLRAVNAGISVYVDPTGRVVHRTGVTDSDVDGYRGAEGFVATVAMMDPASRTVYGYTGELFDVLVVLSLVLLAWRRRSGVVG